MTIPRHQRDAQPSYALGSTKSDMTCEGSQDIQNRRMDLVEIKIFLTFEDHALMEILSGNSHQTADGRRKWNPEQCCT
jgi:hypothetical protein